MSSIPNPGMLPLSEAGGALSGANFGVFYTVLMQVGYKHFAPRVLEQLKNGMPLFEALQQIQAELRPFNDKIMKDAVDMLPSMLDITMQMLERFLQEGVQSGRRNVQGGLGLADLFSGLFPSLPPAEARRGAPGQQVYEQFQSSSTSKSPVAFGETHIKYGHPGHKHGAEAGIGGTPTAQLSIAEKATQQAKVQAGMSGKRKAGQSQILERKRLIGIIATSSKAIIAPGHFASASARANSIRQNKETLQKAQQALVNLISRYSF